MGREKGIMERNKPTKIKQVDITRALKAAMSAGLKVSRVEITDGKLSISMANGTIVEPPSTPFDAWRDKRNARPA